MIKSLFHARFEKKGLSLFCVSFIFRIPDFDMRLSIDLDMFMRRIFEILVKRRMKDALRCRLRRRMCV